MQGCSSSPTSPSRAAAERAVQRLQRRFGIATTFAIRPPKYVRQHAVLDSRWPVILQFSGGKVSKLETARVSGSVVQGYGANHMTVGPEYFADPYVRQSDIDARPGPVDDNIPVYFTFRNGITYSEPSVGGSRFRFEPRLCYRMDATEPGGERAWIQWTTALPDPETQVFGGDEYNNCPEAGKCLLLPLQTYLHLLQCNTCTDRFKTSQK